MTSIIVESPVRRRRVSVGGIDIKVKIGGLILLFYAFVALVGVHLTQDPLQQDLTNRLASPSSAHWLGTDGLGRDELARLVAASRVDIRFGLVAMAVPVVIGTVLGAVAGYRGGAVDSVIMRLADLVQSFPILLLFLVVAAATGATEGWFILGPGELPIIAVFALVGWVVYARLIRAEIIRLRQVDFVVAARSGGLSSTRVLATHVIPNAIPQTIVYAVVDVGLGVLALASISFLGLGIPAPIPEWGSMINDGRLYISDQWWLVVAPGLAIAGLGLGLALIGDSFDDRLKR